MRRKETFRQQSIRLNERYNGKRFSLTSMAICQIAKRMFPDGVIMTKRHAYCSHCGCEIDYTGQHECPQCHTKWTDKPERVERASRLMRYDYYCEMSVAEGLQVLRFWYVERYFTLKHGGQFWVREVQRQFINDKGERKCFALGRPMFSGGRYDAWAWSTDMRLRNPWPISYYSYWVVPRFDLPCEIVKIKSVIPMLRRNGLRSSVKGMWFPVSLVLGLLSKPWIETMWKQGFVGMLNELLRHERTPSEDVLTALRICHRNHYQISDPSMWMDYVTLLAHYHLDLHNAHYVCPADLKAEHDRLVERKRRDDERRRAEEEARRERERLEQDKKRLAMLTKQKAEYPKRWGVVLSLAINGEDISIKPLQSIEEFQQEGTAMHHCVFQMGYYNEKTHPNTLILSAKDSEGKRLATIEYNTKRHDIVQCRAACNKVPERDQEIRQLITDHRKDIEALLMKETKAKAKKKRNKTAAVAA